MFIEMKDSLMAADKYYAQGSYVLCQQSYRSIREQLRPTLSKANNKDFRIDQQTLACLLENNILVLKSLILIKKPGNYELWNDIMQSFLQLNYEFDSLLKLNIVPLKYYLNIVHNTLWWGWCYPYAFQSDECHVDICINLSIDCFRRVLETVKDEYASSCFTNNKELLIYVMKRVSDSILKINGEDLICLIDIVAIIMLIFLEQKVERELCISCIVILTSILYKRNHLLKIADNKSLQENNVWQSTYKFGLFEISSSMERNDIQNTLLVMKICCSTFNILVEDFSKCDQCLETVEVDAHEYNFIANYIKAFACYLQDDFEASLMYVALLEKIPVNFEMNAKYNFLFGLILSKLGRHYESLKEIFKSLTENLKTKSNSSALALTLYYVAKEYDNLFKKYKEYNHNKKDTETSLYHSLQSSHLDSLQNVVKVMRESETERKKLFLYNCNLRILDVLHSQLKMNLPKALYLLATTLAEVGDNHAAGEIYVELLSKFHQIPGHCLESQIPEISVIYHNAIVLFLRCNKTKKAESLCRQAITSYVPKRAGLLSMEDDLVALMLLAHIHKIKNEYILQSETLDRCLRLISNYKMEKEHSRKSETVSEQRKNAGSSVVSILHLLNMFSAKLHVQKARNYMTRSLSFRKDAFYELKQAMICNPGDGDAMKAYHSLLNETHEHSLTQDVNILSLPVEDCSNIVLTYILQCYLHEETENMDSS